MLKVGDAAPDFTMVADNGETVTLASLRGQRVVLYFYPKDDTPGCTVEAQDFSAALPEFRALRAEVFGVSRDTTKRHQSFCKKHGLTVRLLTDGEDAAVHKAFGAWGEKKLYGKVSEGCIRSTFLLDEEGVVRAVWSPVKVLGHAAAVLEALRGENREEIRAQIHRAAVKAVTPATDDVATTKPRRKKTPAP
jgi:peroxiredoxin Q/BCP